jgi:hypothetical protein
MQVNSDAILNPILRNLFAESSTKDGQYQQIDHQSAVQGTLARPGLPSRGHEV